MSNATTPHMKLFKYSYDKYLTKTNFKIMELLENENTFSLSTEFSSLFYETSKSGVFAIRPGKYTNHRMHFYQNIGRFIGITLRNDEQTMFNFTRYIYKYILGQDINWLDMAFYDESLHNSMECLLNLAMNEDTKHQISDLELSFIYELSNNEGCGYIELIKDGSNVLVNSENIKDYIYEFSKMKLHTLVEPALFALKKGLHEIIPLHLLHNFTVEDLRISIGGIQSFKSEHVINNIVFYDGSNAPAKSVSNLKKWFFAFIRQLSQQHLKDL
ncbi:MAG: E3 ubiquitin-protein ligase ubr5, partial [Paramarteilia canceri]